MTTDERSRHEPVASERSPPSGAMRARRWTIAACFHSPTDYDIPTLPDWTVYRDEDGGLAFGAAGGVFIRADNPVKVRR